MFRFSSFQWVLHVIVVTVSSCYNVTSTASSKHDFNSTMIMTERVFYEEWLNFDKSPAEICGEGCGQTNPAAVVMRPNYDYSFMASVRINEGGTEENSFRHSGNGARISRLHVLCAASILTRAGHHLLPKRNVQVQFHGSDSVHNVEKLFISKEYQTLPQPNCDYGLIRLEGHDSIQSNPVILCFPPPKSKFSITSDFTRQISLTNRGGTLFLETLVIKDNKVPIYKRSHCKSSFRDRNKIFCSGCFRSWKGPCMTEEGSPVVFNCKRHDVLVGVTPLHNRHRGSTFSVYSYVKVDSEMFYWISDIMDEVDEEPCIKDCRSPTIINQLQNLEGGRH